MCPVDAMEEEELCAGPAGVLLADSVGERSNFKKFPTHTQDHGDDIATRGECCLRTLVDRSGSVDAT